MHTHYHAASKTWFTPSTCETCGGDTQQPNAVKLHAAYMMTKPLVYVDTLPAETYYDDRTDKEVCEDCAIAARRS